MTRRSIGRRSREEGNQKAADERVERKFDIRRERERERVTSERQRHRKHVTEIHGKLSKGKKKKK